LHHTSVRRTPRRRFPVLALWLALAAPGSGARADTWIDQAQAALTCTALADPGESAQLSAPALDGTAGADAARRYFSAAPRDVRHARFRHLALLSSVAWWADLVNDQAVRGEALATIGVLADRYAGETDDLLFAQISRCTRAQLLSSVMELGRVADLSALASTLAGQMPATLPPQSAEDWPLMLALRELKLEPQAREGLVALSGVATRYAASAAKTNQPLRASRLYAAAAEATLALGDAKQAQQLALQSMLLTGKPPAATAAWQAMPTLYDSALALHGAADAALLERLLVPDQPPATLGDRRVAFESLHRLAGAAETTGQYAVMSRRAADAFKLLSNLRGADVYSVPFYRHALLELAQERDTDLGTLAQQDAAFGARTLATYDGLVGKLVSQAQGQFVSDAREQLNSQYKIDNVLHAYAELHGAMPRSQPQIADNAFRLAQLRTFGRLTLATLQAELARSNIDEGSRFDVERFFSLATQTAVWLRGLLGTLQAPAGAALPDTATLWKAFFALDVFYNETAKEYANYVAFIRQKAPGVAALATPKPQPASEFQRRLQNHEAIVATLVTPTDLYAWAITTDDVGFVRRKTSDRNVTALVQRLRAGLVPTTDGGSVKLPEFDAQAAWELYQLVFAPFEPQLRGVTDVLWYGHGPLGAVPPAVLIPSRPAKSRLSTAADFSATPFLVDRYAFAALADLSLFLWHRDRVVQRAESRFLGVGAPLLSAAELAGSTQARSYELAGGIDGKELAALPKLPETVDELEALAAISGKQQSTLWLGPDASEQQFVGAKLRGYGMIALATHGFLPGEIRNVPEPALMLALDLERKDRFDGILTSREIAALELDADLVILSACNTAGADGRPRGEAFTGLSQAFFTAGARSLLVSHWPVMSGAAVQLSVGTLERARNDRTSLARSLQQAMIATRKAGAASRVESHPSYWAPFVVVGDGR
jgi:CHAT domain-containing protein